MRRFYFVRQTDVSGTSGTGAVCEGVWFSDGRVVIHWLTYLSSVAIYDSIDDAIAIHGHGGETNIVWVDDDHSLPPVDTERPPGWSDARDETAMTRLLEISIDSKAVPGQEIRITTAGEGEIR
jgi:hypothetical protein